MRKNQNGFGAVEALISLAVFGLIGVAAWYVRSLGNKPGQAGTSASNTVDSSPVKADWKKVSQSGLTISYPEAWDAAFGH